MDFVERMFGFSPDGGTGALEFLYVVSVAAAITVVAREFYRRGKSKQGPDGINQRADRITQRSMTTRCTKPPAQ